MRFAYDVRPSAKKNSLLYLLFSEREGQTSVDSVLEIFHGFEPLHVNRKRYWLTTVFIKLFITSVASDSADRVREALAWKELCLFLANTLSPSLSFSFSLPLC